MRRRLTCLLLTAGLVFPLCGRAAAHEGPDEHRHIENPNEHFYIKFRKKHPKPPTEHSDHRAGYPQCVACYAVPAYIKGWTGYYVGGGAAVHGECRGPADGTWGWDYEGHYLPHRVILRWWHGKYQGGRGAYEPNGPEVPNVIPTLTHPVESLKAHREERREKRGHGGGHEAHGEMTKHE
jgi:hypothetical protein